MLIDDLDKDQLYKLIDFIGPGSRPIKAARKIFSTYETRHKGYVRETRYMVLYAHNKVTAMNLTDDRNKFVQYLEICAKIWVEDLKHARSIDLTPFVS